ncbi:MAG: carboxypeptidase regulatory-like domain-containing protein [Deltaproteobacteria bacterium]|nr:carboxypeptidase regulatory-like domain-containing protein [Deltaproteobacteria bacterium]
MSQITRSFSGLSLLVTLSACTDASIKGNADEVAGFDTSDSLTVPAPPTLRFDVLPPYNQTDGALLSETFTAQAGEGPIVLEMSTPTRVTGVLTGYDATPQTLIEVPGEVVRVIGRLDAWVPDTIIGDSVVTDDSGRFDLSLVPNEAYVLAWVPESPSDLPMVVALDQSISGRSMDLSQYLDYGVPFVGRVTDSDGDAVEGLPVALVDPETGVTGVTVLTDSSGRYALRTNPGEWMVRVGSASVLGVPVQELLVDVPDEGVFVPVEYGDLTSDHLVDGEIVNMAGETVRGVIVRLVSRSLDDTPDGSLVTEADTSSNGRFSVRVQPGEYDVYLLPAANSGYSPSRLPEPVRFEAGRSDLGVMTLRPQVTATGSLLNSEGLALAGVLVRAKEADFEGNVFETVADDFGKFSLSVSEGELNWTFTPSTVSLAAVTHMTLTGQELSEQEFITLSEGELVEGRVMWEGEPIRFASIELGDEDDRMYGRTLTNDAGEFSFRIDWR